MNKPVDTPMNMPVSDFGMQRHLRELDRPRPPEADLWPAIAARISMPATTAHRHRRAGWLPFAAAAALLVAVGATLFAVRQPATLPGPVATLDDARVDPVAPVDAGASANTRGADPRLVGAAVVLDAAHAELEQALQQRPDAVFLVGLLDRTSARREKLDHYGANAG